MKHLKVALEITFTLVALALAAPWVYSFWLRYVEWVSDVAFLYLGVVW